ncbi:MAG: GNAT family N-acetyltransferase [Oscillospiraceae bacterium]|nr:GNAT family N-acetyltransferase [Oscillospiraceae bacterium]
MILKTERLTIRRIVADDWKMIKEIWVDFNTSALSQYDVPHDTDDEDVRARVMRWETTNGSFEHIFLAVCLDDTVIGYIDAHKTEAGYEIGYCFHSAYHGKGYAYESTKALVEYFVSECGATRFTAGTAVDNIPSCRLLEKLGFTCVSTETVSFNNAFSFQGGNYVLNVK